MQRTHLQPGHPASTAYAALLSWAWVLRARAWGSPRCPAGREKSGPLPGGQGQDRGAVSVCCSGSHWTCGPASRPSWQGQGHSHCGLALCLVLSWGPGALRRVSMWPAALRSRSTELCAPGAPAVLGHSVPAALQRGSCPHSTGVGGGGDTCSNPQTQLPSAGSAQTALPAGEASAAEPGGQVTSKNGAARAQSGPRRGAGPHFRHGFLPHISHSPLPWTLPSERISASRFPVFRDTYSELQAPSSSMTMTLPAQGQGRGAAGQVPGTECAGQDWKLALMEAPAGASVPSGRSSLGGQRQGGAFVPTSCTGVSEPSRGEAERLCSTCWSGWPRLGEGVRAPLGLPELPTTCGSLGPGQGANAWPFREQCSGAKGLLRGPPLQP